jgi:uncharacterized RDD family membrane protein YckC
MSSLPAGWYKDPADPVTQRYWDGEGWLGKAIPADAVPPDGPPPPEEPEPPVVEEPVPGLVAQPPPGLPPAYQTPPQGYQAPPPGWVPPPGYPAPPPGWVPPPGYAAPPSGWVPPPGFRYPMPYPVQARPHGFALAGLGERLVARILDILAVLVLNVVVNGYFAYQFWLEAKPTIKASMDDPFGDPPPASGRLDTLVWIMLVVATLLWLLYEAPSTASRGQTLGKRIMRIKVIKLDDTKPLGFGLAFRRWTRLGLWTPFWGCLGIGALFQLIDSVSPLFDQQLRQALHDKKVRTVVVALPPNHGPTVDAASGGAGDSTGGQR